MCGDFNFPNENFEENIGDGEGNRLTNFLENNFLTQHVSEPTRGGNILDLVITNSEELVNNLEIRDGLNGSDHCALEFGITLESGVDSNRTMVPDFRRANFNQFREYLVEANLTQEFEALNALGSWECFNYVKVPRN